MQYPTFLEVLKQLGPTDKDRAAKLGVTTRTLSNWRKNPLTAQLDILVREPDLIDALLTDTHKPADVAAN